MTGIRFTKPLAPLFLFETTDSLKPEFVRFNFISFLFLFLQYVHVATAVYFGTKFCVGGDVMLWGERRAVDKR